MTVAQMHILFKVELDKVDTLSYPDISPNELDLILNDTQDLFVTQRYREFELIQKRTDDLRTLVLTTTLTPVSVTGTTLYSVTLPSDYWFYLRSSSVGTGIVCGVSQSIPLKNVLTTHDRVDVLLDDPFNSPDTSQALIYFEGNTMLINTGGNVLTSVNLTYLRKPLRMSLGATGINSPVGATNICELPDNTHREIVAMAVRRTLEIVESVRYSNNRQEPIE